MNVDWNAFNQNMQNMATSMQQMTSTAPIPHFLPPNPPQNLAFQANIPHQIHHHQHHQIHHQFGAAQPQAQSIQQSFIVPTIPIQIGQQPMQQQQQQQLLVNDLNDFAQRITAYSQQMVQSINNVFTPQNMNQMHNNIVFQPQSHQQIVIQNNNGHQQIHQIQHIAAPPLLIINNQQFVLNEQLNDDVIDLTNNDDEEAEMEEYKEEFVPWNDADVPNEYKCPISLEIMTDPVILSDGFYYERECIEDWLRNHDRSPMTNLRLNGATITTDHAFRHKINKWKQNEWDIYDANNMEDDQSEYIEHNVVMEHDHESDVKMKI